MISKIKKMFSEQVQYESSTRKTSGGCEWESLPTPNDNLCPVHGFFCQGDLKMLTVSDLNEKTDTDIKELISGGLTSILKDHQKRSGVTKNFTEKKSRPPKAINSLDLITILSKRVVIFFCRETVCVERLIILK